MATPLSLSELNDTVKKALTEHLEPSYWVVAEVGQMQVTQRGHCYLELVEKTDDRMVAKMRATIWAYSYRVISGWFESVTGHPLEAGMKVLAHGLVQFHEVYGLSFNIKDIDPNYTMGERARKRLEVLQQLESDGVLEMNKELLLPEVPQRVAIISSPTAAGYEDFMEQLGHNGYGYRFSTRLFRATMQGDDAVPSMIGALHEVFEQAERFDVVAILRGGGSQLDLDCFDSYDLAANVAQFPLPVISGIGHERDETIVDLVAHTKMKTPTAVAEFLVGGLRAYEERMLLLMEQVERYTQGYVRDQQHLLGMAGQRLGAATKSALRNRRQGLEQQGWRMANGAKGRVQRQEYILENTAKVVRQAAPRAVQMAQTRLTTLENTLRMLNPQTLLQRGYSLTVAEGKTLKPGDKVATGSTLTTYTAEQVITSRVTDIEDNPYGKEEGTDVSGGL